MAEPAAVATFAPTTPVELPGGAYFKGDEADAEWLLIGAILVFFMRESLICGQLHSESKQLFRARSTEAGFAMLEVGSIQIKNTKNILVRMRARNTWIRVSGRLLTLTGRLFSLRKIADQECV